MKIVVIGGTGLIGSKLLTKLREHGHEVLARIAATRTGHLEEILVHLGHELRALLGCHVGRTGDRGLDL